MNASFAPQVPFSVELLRKAATEPKLLELVFLLAQYPELIYSVPRRNYEPCSVVVYLFQVCHKISSCLDDVYVMDTRNRVDDKEVLVARFWVYWTARVIIGNGMRLLGLKPLERM